jgi:hypothetical protein
VYPVRKGWGKVSVETPGEMPGDNPGERRREVIMVDGRAVDLDIWLKGLREEWTKSSAYG